MSFLTVEHLSRREKGNLVVHDISFSQIKGEKIAIAGETGSGKSSLLRMIAGLLQPDTGSVSFRGQRVLGPFEKLLPGHPGIAYLSQQFELPKNLWVHEVLEYVNRLEQTETRQLYEICRINHLLRRRTDQLSGGERQRVALARLLSTAPDLLLLDEPFSNLDAIHKLQMQRVLHDISTGLGTNCILVSHDGPDLLAWADRILVMREGRFIQDAPPSQVYSQPVNEYCAGLFGEYNLIDSSMPGFDKLNKPEKNDRWLLRPEDLELVSLDEATFVGALLNTYYRGSHQLLEVKVGEDLLTVRTGNVKLLAGDSIGLRIRSF